MTNETLRNCPFCGGKAEFDNASYDDANGNHPYFTVECCNIECIGWIFYDSKELAASAWNRRAPVITEDELETLAYEASKKFVWGTDGT